MRGAVRAFLIILVVSVGGALNDTHGLCFSVPDELTCPSRLFGHTGAVESLAFSPDGACLVAGESTGAIDVWRIGESTGWIERTLSGHMDRVGVVAFSPDGNTLASGSYDGDVLLWNPSSGRQIGRLGARFGPVGSLAFTPDGRALAVATHRGAVEIWSPTTKARSHLLVCYPVEPLRSVGAVQSVAFAPDGRLLAAGCQDGAIRLWETESWSSIGVLTGPATSVNTVGFAAEGKSLVSASMDGAVRIWDVEICELAKVLRPARSAPVLALTVGPAGQTVISGDFNGSIEWWKIDSGARLGGIPQSLPPVSALHFDPRGRFLASAHLGDVVNLWPVPCLTEDEAPPPTADESSARDEPDRSEGAA